MKRHSAIAGWLAFGHVLLMVPPAGALELEFGAQAVATLVSDDSTKGGGVGLGLAAGLSVLPGWPVPRSALVARLGANVLTGAGLVWTLETGVVLRVQLTTCWQPDVGPYLSYTGGALARTIDATGHLANDPVALSMGLSPLRFVLREGWVSFLAARYGATLGRSGYPPLAFSLSIIEIGRAFE